MKVYAIIHDPLGDHAAVYDGMDEPTITTLIQDSGFTFDFVDEATYLAFVLAHQTTPLTPAQILEFVHSQAVSQCVSGADSLSTLQRAILLVILDEINLLRQRDVDRSADVAAAASLADLKTRWAARSALNDRTVAQLKNAVQSRINNGNAD